VYSPRNFDAIYHELDNSMPKGISVSAFAAVAVVVTASFVPRPAIAQQASPPVPAVRADTTVSGRDSATVADVERAAEQLAVAVQEAVRKATESPELKVAALKLATNAVKAAQIVVTQQATTLQTMLEALAREVAAVSAQPAKPPAKTKAH